MLDYLRKDPSVKPVDIQATEFTKDVLGRYVCSTLDEAVGSGGRPFDVVVIGAGMFGAYVADKIYRRGADQNLRVLVLDAGSFVLPTHAQNLPRLGFDAPATELVVDNDHDPQERRGVWGMPWHSNTKFSGLAYCVGGRSVFWGGWAPRMTDADLAAWPKPARDFLAAHYDSVESEIGVDAKADYLYGPVNREINDELTRIVGGGLALTAGVQAQRVEEAPLAVQAGAPGPGLFSFDKYSSVPLLLESVRDDIGRRWLNGDNSARRLFLVPRAHVIRLQHSGGAVTGIELAYNGERRTLSAPGNLSPDCQVVIAAGTIESTRLALESFPVVRGAYSMGANFMAHLRSNLTVRVKRSALGLAPSNVLEQGGALVRGEITNPDGSKRRYHFQVLASAAKGTNPEATMWTMVPDVDLLGKLLANHDPDWVTVVFRGIGEMDGDRRSQPGSVTSFIDLANGYDAQQRDEFSARRAWVQFSPTANDYAAWDKMAAAAVQLAAKLGKAGDVEYLRGGAWTAVAPTDASYTKDELGNTHHEGGTLWMGDDGATSITDPEGRFHHVRNAYVAGPALFPTIGSANPSLTGLTLGLSTADAVVRALAPAPSPTARLLYQGDLRNWQMAGGGRFIQVYDLLESQGGSGLLWYTREMFSDFVLELDWQHASRDDNSGIFIRIPGLNRSKPAEDCTPAIQGGYEIQIDPRGYNAETNLENDPLRSTGAIYNLKAPLRTDVARGPWQWNTLSIEAIGPRIRVMLNDVLVNDFVDPKPRSLRGHIALQNHHAGSKVQFRNIRIRNAALAPVAPARATGRPGRIADTEPAVV